MGTVPMLTPADTAIWDDDVIADLEKRFDDEIPCTACGKPASHLLICRGGCGTRSNVCPRCLALARAIAEVKRLSCQVCGYLAQRPGVDAMWKVVPL